MIMSGLGRAMYIRRGPLLSSTDTQMPPRSRRPDWPGGMISGSERGWEVPGSLGSRLVIAKDVWRRRPGAMGRGLAFQNISASAACFDAFNQLVDDGASRKRRQPMGSPEEDFGSENGWGPE